MNVIELFKQKREPLFDLLKLYALLSVALDHCLVKFINQQIITTQLYNWIFISQMPIFMFVSGYFTQKKLFENLSFKEFGFKLLKITASFLIPFVSFSIINSFCLLQFELVFSNLAKSFLEPTLSLWFLWVLMIIELVMSFSIFVVGRLVKKNLYVKFVFSLITYVLFLTPLIIVALFNPTIFGIKLILYYSLFFLFGYFVHFSFERFAFLKKPLTNVVLFVTSLLAVVVIMIFHPQIINEPETFVNIIFRIISSICAISVVTYICWLISKIGLFKWLSKFGRLSLEFYYVHLLLFNAPFLKFACDFSNQVLGVLEFFGIYCSIVLVSFGIICLLKFSPIIDLVIFGKVPYRLNKETSLKQR